MPKRTKIIFIVYSIWVIIFLLISIYGKLFTEHSEYSISSHLWLTLTGMPSSFVSWGVPHGSILGVFIAGIAGVTQWLAISSFWEWKDKKSAKHNCKT